MDGSHHKWIDATLEPTQGQPWKTVVRGNLHNRSCCASVIFCEERKIAKVKNIEEFICSGEWLGCLGQGPQEGERFKDKGQEVRRIGMQIDRPMAVGMKCEDVFYHSNDLQKATTLNPNRQNDLASWCQIASVTGYLGATSQSQRLVYSRPPEITNLPGTEDDVQLPVCPLWTQANHLWPVDYTMPFSPWEKQFILTGIKTYSTNSKFIMDLHVKCKAIKLWGKKNRRISLKLRDRQKEFFDLTPKSSTRRNW